MSKKQRIIGVISLIILVFLGYIGYSVVSGPAVGVVQNSAPPSESKSTAPDMSGVPVNGVYVSFERPNAFTLLPAEELRKPTVESFSYQYKPSGGGAWRLSISVHDISASASKQSTSYQLRASKPTQYEQSTQTVSGKTFVIMRDTTADGFSKVAYSSSGNLMADISLQGGSVDQVQELQALFDSMLDSWQWK